VIRGQADAEAIAIYAAAFGADSEFYEFLRTLQSYETFFDQNTTLILPADSQLLKYLNPSALNTAPTQAPTPELGGTQ
jgi:membrane protease subunit HflC